VQSTTYFSQGGGTHTINYVDYKNQTHIASLNNVKLKAEFWDYASWVMPIPGPLGRGIYNWFKDKP
jgi:hypothetical protein